MFLEYSILDGFENDVTMNRPLQSEYIYITRTNIRQNFQITIF